MPKKTQSFLRRLIRKGPNKLLNPPHSNAAQDPSTDLSRSSPKISFAEPESILEDTTRSANNTQKHNKKNNTGKVVGWYRRKGDHNPKNYRVKLEESLKDHELYARLTEFPPKKLSKAQKQKEDPEFQRGFQAGLAAQKESKTRSVGSREGHMDIPRGSSPLVSGGLGATPVGVVSDGIAGGEPGFLSPGGGFERDGNISGNLATGGFSTSPNVRNKRSRKTGQSS